MCEGAVAVHVANCEYTFGVRPAEVVDLDEAARICFDRRGVKIETIGVGPPSGCDEQMRTVDFDGATIPVRVYTHAGWSRRDPRHFSSCDNPNSLVLEHLSDRLGDILVFSLHEVPGMLEDRDLRPKATEDLREFNTDVPATDDHQVLR